jgi:hypothetical protein
MGMYLSVCVRVVCGVWCVVAVCGMVCFVCCGRDQRGITLSLDLELLLHCRNAGARRAGIRA